MTLIVKDGIRIRSGPGRPLPLRRRSVAVPAFWRPVGDGARTRASEQVLAQWILVLSSKKIPFVLARRGGRRRIYVPVLFETFAKDEIAGYSAEPTAGRVRIPVSPARNNARPVALFFVLLLGWHGVHAGWWEFSCFASPTHTEWVRLGALDVYRVRVLHEWHRTVTALSLHADSPHLFGNVAAGCLFLSMLCRRIGFGSGLFLTVLGGALGNACNVLYRPLSFSSVGFSTALFACLGLLSAIQAIREENRRKALLPLGAGMGLFAMLGTEGERSDYAAHLFGMAVGLLLGCAYCRLAPHVCPPPAARIRVALIALAAPALFVLAWFFALS